ncbi:hypothetical protein RJT34_12309 [Clitoria ternatea]|uniref:Uncharacterized protein n=1 Tax=Clitoria ternatea TaxID=43366 RepID=A0AAN9PJ72_CLITE
MGRALIKNDPGDSNMIESPKGLDSDEYRRLERRWKRRERSNDFLKHHHCSSAKKLTVNLEGNMAILTGKDGHISGDEIDEDYKMYLDSYASDIDVVCDDNVDGPDIDVNIGYNNDNDVDDVDEDYKFFLSSLGIEDESEPVPTPKDFKKGLCKKRPHQDVVSIPKVNCHSNEDLDYVDEDYQLYLISCNESMEQRTHEIVSSVPKSNWHSNVQLVDVDEEYQLFLNSHRKDDSGPMQSPKDLKTEKGLHKNSPHQDVPSIPKVNCHSKEDLDYVDVDYQLYLISCESMEYQKNFETERGLCKKRPNQNVSNVPRSNCHSNVDLVDVDEDYQLFLNSCRIEDDSVVYAGSEFIGKSSSCRQNSHVSDRTFGTPETPSEIDEEYQLFLDSAKNVDGDMLYMPERSASKLDNVDGGSDSSDSDLIILEADQIYENTPFVSSKAYDASWFEDKMNPRDCSQLSACVHSQFRIRLMEDLQRPYDQEELDGLLHEVNQKRQKERHAETRRGEIKHYVLNGFNKSYFELYPDLAKAVHEVKEPERVLFLLRGFIFWLQNMAHDGAFRPWLDESCLKFREYEQMESCYFSELGRACV